MLRPEDTLEESIQNLRQLHIDGLITEAEHDECEAHILQSRSLDHQLHELINQREQQQKEQQQLSRVSSPTEDLLFDI